MPKSLSIPKYECKDYSWDEVDKKAEEILANLIYEKYSSVDILHIAQRLQFAGNYLSTLDSLRFAIEANMVEGETR